MGDMSNGDARNAPYIILSIRDNNFHANPYESVLAGLLSTIWEVFMRNKRVMVFTLGNVVAQPKTQYVFENAEAEYTTNKRSQEFYDAFADRLNVIAWACGHYGHRAYSPEDNIAYSEKLMKRMDKFLKNTEVDLSIQMVGYPLIKHKEPYFIVCDYIPHVNVEIMDTIHFPYFNKSYTQSQDYLYKEAKGIICYTSVQRYMLINWMHLDPCKITTICSGVKGFVDKKYKKRKSKLILWVGVDFELKGGAEVVETFLKLYQRDQEYRLVMVGVEKEITHPGITVIPFLCNDDFARLDCLYKEAAVFVMPSYKENLGLVYLEAMAHKTPVIVSSRGGMAEIIRRTQAGIVVPPGNSKLLYDSILEVLSEDKYEDYSQKAYEFADKNAHWEISAERMIDAMEKWLKDKPVPDDYTDYSISEALLPYESVIHKGLP